MKKLQYLFLSALLATVLYSCSTPTQEKEPVAEEPVETFLITEGHAPIWKEAITQITELADAMPEDMYSYRPHDSVRTFAEQLVHIGGASKVIANLFLKDLPPEQTPGPDVSSMSKQDIVAMVTQSLNETWDIMKTTSDQKLAEQIKSFAGNDMTRMEGMFLVHDHLSNHKAKANLYVRMSNNQPPSYRYY